MEREREIERGSGIGPDGNKHMDGRKLRPRTVHNGRTDADGLHLCVEETGSKTHSSVELRLKTDHRAVFSVLSLRCRLRHSAKPGVNL